MELTFMNDLGQSFVVDIDPNMELENVMALLEVEVRSILCFSSPADHRIDFVSPLDLSRFFVVRNNQVGDSGERAKRVL